jgi:hypothetical protein
VRINGLGESLLKIDGQRVEPSVYGKSLGEPKEFPVPKEALQDRRLVLTWDRPDEAHLNWRQQSQIGELWLIKK